MFKRIAGWLIKSPHIHVRQHAIRNALDLVGLMDRFLDDELKYELEWDDFVSWEHSNLFIEGVRKEISKLEPLFLSKDINDRNRAIALLTDERNRIAALCGGKERPGYQSL